jgi:hypothetical protein
MKKTLLWLDDTRDPNVLLEMYTWAKTYSPIGVDDVEIIWLKTYNQFCNWINKFGLPTAICFDNDLGEKMEGYDCAKWLVEYCMNYNKKLPKYNVHSYNTVARENIFKLLDNFNKLC